MRTSRFRFLTALLAVIFVFNQGHQLAIAEVQTDSVNDWHNRQSLMVAGYSAEAQYAADHILVKRQGQAVQVVDIGDSTVSEAVASWSQQADVEYVEPDGLYRALAQETAWGWTTVKASEAATTNSATGSGIIVAVIDTGVDYDHEDLANNNWINTDETDGDNDDDDGNGYVDDRLGYDFIGSMYTAITPDSDPIDEHGHGTHVSGIIAAENNTLGTRGVAPSATIMPVKVLDANGVGFDSTIADGIRYAVDNGANIINMSLGGSASSTTLKSAIDYAEAHNVLVIAASGNEYSFTSASYPALYSNVVSVGATNEDGYKAIYSNWGKVDVIAPGDDILSTTLGNTYTRMSGTSMASPHAAGVAALIMQTQATTSAPLARQILETTTDDFGILSGNDYMSGRGMVNALTATTAITSGSTYLYADQGYVVSDASDSVTISVSVRNSSKAAVSGDTVTWSTDKGTLSASTSNTNASGVASVTLTADDTNGLATITADPATEASTDMQLAIMSDIPQPDSIGIKHFGDATITTETGDSSAMGNVIFQAGDEVTIWANVTSYDKETHTTTATYSVTDPDGTAVTDLAGTTESFDVGTLLFGFYYIPQSAIASAPLTIPSDAATGEYTLTVTTTDADTSETATRTSHFWVGSTLPDVLLVDNNGYCYDTPVEGLSFGFAAYCTSAAHLTAQAIEDAGYTVMIWDTTQHSTPSATDLAQFSAVVWVDATFSFADTAALQTYLDAGGNLLLTSEPTASYNTASDVPSDFLWDYLHARWVSVLEQPDLVTGVSGGPFAAVDYNISTYDLEGNGTHATYTADEIELNPADDAEALFQYDQGDSTNRTAGVRVDTGTYRAVYLAFGLETINDGSGDATKGAVMTTLLDWMIGDRPTVTSVSDRKFKNNVDHTISITGENFSMLGETKVWLDSTRLTDVTVVDRDTIRVTVPAGLTPGWYTVKVVNPDGQKGKKTKAVHLVRAGLSVTSSDTSLVTNDKDSTISLAGTHFKQRSTVWFNTTKLTDVTFTSSNALSVVVPADFAPGHYTVKVKTGSHQAKLSDKITVRYGFTDTWQVGESTPGVLSLEKRLKNYGYFTGTPDQDFTDKTEGALQRYQLDRSLPVTGVTDYLTRYTLNTNE